MRPLKPLRSMTQAGYKLSRTGISRQGPRDHAPFIDPDLKEITRYTLSYCAALTYVSIGQKDKAFEWLEKARVGRDASFPFLTHDPRFDPVKSDPRFKRLADSLRKPA